MTAAPITNPRLDTPSALQAFMRADYPLSPQQFTAVTAPLEPAVVIAGAGSGKTTLMAARVVWLVGTGQVRPEEILGLTFTTKAASELGTRIRSALSAAGIPPPRGTVRADRDDASEDLLEPTVATYNAYAASLLTEHGLRIGHEPDTRVIADASRYQLAARVIARYDGTVKLLSDHPATVIGYVLGLDAALSEHLVSPEQLRAFHRRERPAFAEALAVSKAKVDLEKVLSAIDRREELVGLVERYRALKQHLGLMEFSDQIELAARLADLRPEVGHAERAKFKVVLLDEYQDTSVAQALMLRRLFSGATREEGRGHPVTAVGDPNQAIYGWRGASVSNILRFGEDFPAADGSTAVPSYPLTVNRRSDRRILAVANELARPLLAEFPMVKPLEAPEEAAEGTVGAEVFETYDDELSWLTGEVTAAHERCGSWREIGVLTRDNAHAADVFRALSEAEIPVEIVGLKGLLALPEVAEVVATLMLLHDLTANAALLTLLTGPRWAIGPRDLALLGRRAERLAGGRRRRGSEPHRPLAEELEEAVSGVDPTEVPSLSDALDDPGEGDYSPEARERFALLSAELRYLRGSTGEPLLDLVRRIIDVTGIDVELASSVSPAARARRENLDLFVRAVADFQAIDGAVTLPALVAYLQAEDESGGNGLDVATPTEADSVKLLTVHRAKGLEWDVVFLVGVARDKFPSNRTRIKWTSGPGILPYALRGDARDLPVLRGHTKADLGAFAEDSKAHESQEELRLGYVAFTRPRHELVVSSYCWTASRKTGNGPSAYQEVVKTMLASWGETPPRWRDVPGKDQVNPLLATRVSRPWPVETHSDEVARRLAAAQLVRTEMERRAAASSSTWQPDSEADGERHLAADEAELLAAWDREAERLLAEARARRATTVEVPLPSSLSATSLAALRDDPDAFASSLARPMPRPPSPAARFGTRFHAWVEAWYDADRQDLLVDPDELSGRADLGVDDDADLEELIAKFRSGPFAERRAVAIEPSFALVLDGQVVRGRIDAVFAEEDGGVLLVDWKTNRAHSADPLQLAVYRLAWSELHGVPLEKIRAAFYYVRDGDVVEPPDLPGRAQLELLLRAEPPSMSG
ncbi:MAG: ATP-dependent DNA helicase SCO5184 [uncultured Nocardioidaceae bacterium]|uniref:DNA 3'-5' helicase n=1 Tax=uncultured Nocardioidaceae bacterium TaxID=253824 RepID=A0A6J4MG31_9ACTN|nr:MAG: ATP-dependent DNA helicase SCO5184 [uncultured Nocardioidaceae bacterium]